MAASRPTVAVFSPQRGVVRRVAVGGCEVTLRTCETPAPRGFRRGPGVRPPARRTAVLSRLSLCALFVVFAACPGPTPDCRVGADCASGVCLRDGTCQAPAVDAGTDAGTTLEDGGTLVTDAGLDAGSTDGGHDAGFDAGTPVGCLPNHDGTIERGEVFFQSGLRATFKISGAATFNTAGATATDGGRTWDFTGALAGDSSRLVETKPLAGEWYEASYPDAGYVTELSTGFLGVFGTTSEGLYLQGVVSPTSGSGETKVTYTPWIKVLQFPLTAGASWNTETTVEGKYEGKTIGSFQFVGVLGLPFQKEVYTSTVDRSGDAVTPFATFPTLRVRTVLDRSTSIYGAVWTHLLTKRTYSWNTECFGTVAAATSVDDEASTEFTSAAEVRRLSP